MQFHNSRYESEELTYDDVFLFQNYFSGKSRLTDTNIHPQNPLPSTLPIVSANMNAVTGKRLAETLARYGGIGFLPQDMDVEKMLEIVRHIQAAHPVFDTPLTLSPSEYVRDALSIIDKRAHNCVILVDKTHRPIAVFTHKDLELYEQFTLL